MMHASNFLFVVSAVICAVSVNIGMLIAGRIIMGIAGCVPAVIGGGYIADLMPVEKRGRTIAIWSCGYSLVRSHCFNVVRLTNNNIQQGSVIGMESAGVNCRLLV